MGLTQITIVRHGETEWNKAMRLQGHQDSPLTPLGFKQAQLVAEGIKTRHFDKLYSSDLERAVKTAESINVNFNLEILQSSQLRERAFGVMEGLTREQIQDKYPHLFNVYMHRNSNEAIPDGENLSEFSERIIKEIQRIADINNNKKVLIVAHGGVLDCVIRKIFNMKVDEKRSFTLLNSSINTFSIKGDKWMLEEWGNIDHMQGLNALNEVN
jgi:probable phosphoglycerate mutase